MKLYYMPGACSLAPHVTAREIGIELDLVKVGRDKRLPDGSDYLEINGKGFVPALELDDGEVLTEVAAIVQYLADRAPASELAPPWGSMQRYRLIEWLNFVSTELHKSFTPLFSPVASDDWKDGARAILARRLDWLARQLEGREHLVGEQLTVADIYLFAVLRWTRIVKFDLGRWPDLLAFLTRIGERPAVKAAFAAEGIKQ